MSQHEQSDLLKELQRDLLRKYELHGERVGDIWRSWSPPQRAKALKAGAAEGAMLKSKTDRSLGDIRLITPDWNLQDLTSPSPEPSTFMLHLRHRAMTPLPEQYAQGPNGEPGDAEVIFRGMERGLENNESFRYEFTRFDSPEDYGRSYAVKDATLYRQVMAGMAAAVRARVIVPRETGELVLKRQFVFLQHLNILVEDILDLGSSTSFEPAKPRKANKKKSTAVPGFKPEKLSLNGLLNRAQDQKASVEDYLALCRTEGAFLAPIVNMWWGTRPELLPDEGGRRLPLHTDKYKSTAFFEVLHSAVMSVAIWDYTGRLLELLVQNSSDKQYRTFVLQELSNVCHFEYDRIQKLFKRYVQTCSGSKYFRRASGGKNQKATRVIMKVKPESLLSENSQLSYMLSLCEPKTSASKSISWITRLDELHNEQPKKLDDLFNAEAEALGDLAATAAFIQTLAASVALPPPNSTKGQAFLSRLKELTTELDSFKDDLDLSEHVVPIDNLLEPSVAAAALVKLHFHIAKKAGAEIGQLHEQISEESLTSVQEQYAQSQAIEKDMETKLSMSESAGPSRELITEKTREKAKTRPESSSKLGIIPSVHAEIKAEEPRKVVKVNRDAFQVFSALFSRGDGQGQGSISWSAFQKAMTSLDFSVVPRFGSVFTFFPPQDFSPPRAFTIHRPHQSRIEGYKLIYFANRLKRIYGWDADSFKAE